MTDKSEIRIAISESDYDKLLHFADKKAECFTDYYFDSDGLWFHHDDSSIRVREYESRYELILCLTKKEGEGEDEKTTTEYKKEITTKDFTTSLVRWLPRDLIEEYPIEWINEPMLHRSLGFFECTDTEQRRISIGKGIFANIKEIDFMNTVTRHEIVFIPKTAAQRTAFFRFLEDKEIKAVIPKKTDYQTLVYTWRKSFLAGDDDLLDTIKITFRGIGTKHITDKQRWDISVHTKEGWLISNAIMKYLVSEHLPAAVSWEEPVKYKDRAKYVVKNLRKALKKVEVSDEFNGRRWTEDENDYKFYGLTQKEYVAIKQAELILHNLVTIDLDDEESELFFAMLEGMPQKEIADKFFEGKERKRDNKIASLYKKLAKGYQRADIEEGGEYPDFEELSPLQQDYLEAAFNIFIALGEEDFNVAELKGANMYWDIGKRGYLSEEDEELIKLHEKLFGKKHR